MNSQVEQAAIPHYPSRETSGLMVARNQDVAVGWPEQARYRTWRRECGIVLNLMCGVIYREYPECIQGQDLARFYQLASLREQAGDRNGKPVRQFNRREV
jgi:hypothetical protein